MYLRKLLASLMICTLVFSCTTSFAVAAETSSEFSISPRAVTTLDHEISANAITTIDDWFYVSSGGKITYDCTYSPSTANLDFGFITPDGLFYSVNCTSGKINRALQIDQKGQYKLAIRNNASYDVVVNGTVKY